MRIQGLKDWITEKGEQGQNSFVTVKSKPLLVQKLVALGVDPDSLQSLQARLNGTLKTVKEFRHPDRDENGLLHFEAVWTSTHMPSRVFYPDLNGPEFSTENYNQGRQHKDAMAEFINTVATEIGLTNGAEGNRRGRPECTRAPACVYKRTYRGSRSDRPSAAISAQVYYSRVRQH